MNLIDLSVGILFYTESAVKSFGHEVIQRQNFQDDGSLKSWVDYHVVLPAGELRNASVFIHGNFEESVPFRLQVWMPEEPITLNYTLLYEYRTLLPVDQGLYSVRFA